MLVYYSLFTGYPFDSALLRTPATIAAMSRGRAPQRRGGAPGNSYVTMYVVLQVVDLSHITPLKAHLVWQALRKTQSTSRR